jgi:hypothetical protein
MDTKLRPLPRKEFFFRLTVLCKHPVNNAERKPWEDWWPRLITKAGLL